MAEKRMFSKKIVESDVFLDMPFSTQALYFHLSLNADDDGIIKNPKRICRMLNANEDDLKLLIMKRFIIPYEPKGLYIVKHWRMNNYLRKDRYNPSEYTEVRKMLYVKENGSYTLDCNKGKPLLEVGIPDGIPVVNTDKNRKDKSSKEKNKYSAEAKEIVAYLNEKTNKKFNPSAKSTVEHINGRLSEGYTVDDFKKVIDNKCEDWLNDKPMNKYLRPNTLFIPSHFDEYLNQGSNDTTNNSRDENVESEWEEV